MSSSYKKDNKMKWYHSLYFKLLLAISFLIIVIEVIILAGTYTHRKNEYSKLYQLTQDNMVKLKRPLTNVEISHEINQLMSMFTENAFFVVCVIIFFVTIGTLIIFHFLVGVPVLRIVKKNKQTDLENIILMEESEIPQNEIGLIMQSRNSMLNLVETMAQKDKERERLLTVNRMAVTYHHEIINPLTIALGNLSMLKPADENKLAEYMEVEKSLKRISDVVKKIEALEEENLEVAPYGNDHEMLKIHK